MKTKMVIVLMLLASLALSSCDSYDESNAKTLIKARVPKCVNIVKVREGNQIDHYAAVDSAYTIHTFSVHWTGKIEELNPKK